MISVYLLLDFFPFVAPYRYGVNITFFAMYPWPSLCEQSELQCCASILRYANLCDFFLVYFPGNFKVLCNIAGEK